MSSASVTKSVPDMNVEPTGKGRVRSFSGSGINAQFESQKEIDDHEVHEAQKKSGPNSMKSFRFRGNSAR